MMTTQILDYWNARAAEHRASRAATTNDVWLRDVEVRALAREIAALGLPPGSTVLDVGCGDGHTTLRLATAFPTLQFVGVDFSREMVANATAALSDGTQTSRNIQFNVADVTKLESVGFAAPFDLVLSGRCLINLESADAQRQAIEQLARALKPGGRYIGIENFHEGNDELNRARVAVGLPAIEVRWHNRYFREDEFREIAAPHFDAVRFIDFSSAYYYATRVVYAKQCQMRGEPPDYDHDLHRLAVDLPDHGAFSPIRMIVATRRPHEARCTAADEQFEADKQANIRRLGQSSSLKAKSIDWIAEASRHNYSHHFTWLGLPVIQFPQDIVALQEIIWRTRPDLIVETGVARGGSLIFHASLLELLGGDRLVCGIDIDIRPHNRTAIESHPLARRIKLIQGSSVDDDVIRQVRGLADGHRRIMVILDSNHAHEHVANELRAYASLVSAGCYLAVLDTIIEDMPKGYFKDRPWDVGDNPQIAVREFLAANDQFEIDQELADKLLITVAPHSYLRRVAEPRSK